MSQRIQVWSSGGGTQSAAIAALICKGELRPDLAVIIDTEREVSQTWDYHENVIEPALKEVGVEIHRVPKSLFAKVDLYSKNGKLLLPCFTKQKGKIGKMPTFCSNEWKARVVQRFARSMFPKCKGFDIWLGISRDEAHRMRSGQKGKWQYKHPLIDDGRLMSRRDCIALVKSMGWPDPPRSRCWMCPNQGTPEWEELALSGEIEKALSLQAEIQKKDPDVMLRDESGSQGACMGGYCYV